MAVENDIVLIYLKKQPLAFARIEEILADHKPGWFHVKLLLLQLPLQVVTWILRDTYIDGAEFTMGGKEMRFEKVVSPAVSHDDKERPQEKNSPLQGGRVISLSDRKRKSSDDGRD